MSKELNMWGLDHCSTCVKARAELEAAGWTITFRDVKTAPLSAAEWAGLYGDFGEKLVNRASLTWRGMKEDERAKTPVEMLEAKPSLIKRPAIAAEGQHFLGWTANVKRALGVAA
ncbi:arsenate reductase family protein [Paracoccus aminophilus]|uniref:Arsenate reductase n=1 Tax=Paracoccus aminophilus JCM 7686 TaxID=1367847 RepID=S5XU55_PARAH|nr:ArsC/Spx/MgsR family protein [Paracoccus aminophilus]AGT08722.1 arsenate reductase [Paracoccus aminophilus JCM 7686]